jgi:hypothetical protein
MNKNMNKLLKEILKHKTFEGRDTVGRKDERTDYT